MRNNGRKGKEMTICRYFPELTLDQVNEIITALSVRMDEKRELYYKCKEAGHEAEAQRIYRQYIALKGAKIQIENAEYRRIEETA